MPPVDDDCGGGTDVAHHTREIRAHCERQEQELPMAGNTQCGAGQFRRVQPGSALGRMGLRQLQITRQREDAAECGHETKHRAPSQRDVDPAPDDRRDRRGEGKNHGHETEQLLRLRPFVQVADDRAPDDGTHPGTHSLEGPEHQQDAEGRGHGAADRGDGIDGQADENHPPPPDRIRQRSLYQ